MDTIGAPAPSAAATGRPRPATAADLAPYLELRDAAARWQLSRGIEQWRPGEWVGPAAQALAAGELWVLDRPGTRSGTASGVTASGDLVGGLIVSWSDAAVWPDDPSNAGGAGGAGGAGYVHGLVVDRSVAGQGLGILLLDHAREQVRVAGRRYLRLDCRAGNQALRAYYAALGFTEVGEVWRSWPGRPDFDAMLALFELEVDTPLVRTGSHTPAGTVR